MVSGIGPCGTLSQYNIPVIADRPGVGQNMWVRTGTVQPSDGASETDAHCDG